MIVPFPLSQSDHQMQRVRHSVEQHRNAPFRSADWLAGELMKICETAPDNDVAALSPQTLPAPGEVPSDRKGAAIPAAAQRLAGMMGCEFVLNELSGNSGQLPATVAAANDEGVAEAFQPFVLSIGDHVPDDKVMMALAHTAGDYRRLAAAIRLLSQGEGK